MWEYKKYVNTFLDDNKEPLKNLARKMNLIREVEKDEFYFLRDRCYRFLAEYDHLIIFGIDGEKRTFKKLYDEFQNDNRVQFWVGPKMGNDIVGNKNVWQVYDANNESSEQMIFDYGDYRVSEKATHTNSVRLIDDRQRANIEKGFLAGPKKEQRLCKIIYALLKDKKQITVSTFERETITYLKGLIKGTGSVNKQLTFALLDGYQNDLMENMKESLYSVAPVVTIEKDRDWNILKLKAKELQNELVAEYKKISKNK